MFSGMLDLVTLFWASKDHSVLFKVTLKSVRLLHTQRTGLEYRTHCWALWRYRAGNTAYFQKQMKRLIFSAPLLYWSKFILGCKHQSDTERTRLIWNIVHIKSSLDFIYRFYGFELAANGHDYPWSRNLLSQTNTRLFFSFNQEGIWVFTLWIYVTVQSVEAADWGSRSCILCATLAECSSDDMWTKSWGSRLLNPLCSWIHDLLATNTVGQKKTVKQVKNNPAPWVSSWQWLNLQVNHRKCFKC